ncbi:phage antirepressor KilAC domain-containing protein [Paenibacillus soyae]|uniref:Phage antirepressor KilAC domain-containing protein n=1 Tax=Paenibacillus soyae TaxID=2969249 RepID=A0A9X2MQL7_9BACL|nr:phage antirepressor KilAC domain-containing protein [Paenibacillus soyae]MCR2804001.1 phage antirepressor KilAC domain-containing protein [Paenibacillus soyae]
MDSSKVFSTTALAKELNIPTKILFETLQDLGFIIRQNDSWELTKKGLDVGGTLKTHPRLGTYIAWQETIKDLLKDTQEAGGKINKCYLVK